MDNLFIIYIFIYMYLYIMWFILKLGDNSAIYNMIHTMYVSIHNFKFLRHKYYLGIILFNTFYDNIIYEYLLKLK